jgi:hypothetical protein
VCKFPARLPTLFSLLAAGAVKRLEGGRYKTVINHQSPLHAPVFCHRKINFGTFVGEDGEEQACLAYDIAEYHLQVVQGCACARRGLPMRGPNSSPLYAESQLIYYHIDFLALHETTLRDFYGQQAVDDAKEVMLSARRHAEERGFPQGRCRVLAYAKPCAMLPVVL